MTTIPDFSHSGVCNAIKGCYGYPWEALERIDKGNPKAIAEYAHGFLRTIVDLTQGDTCFTTAEKYLSQAYGISPDKNAMITNSQKVISPKRRLEFSLQNAQLCSNAFLDIAISLAHAQLEIGIIVNTLDKNLLDIEKSAHNTAHADEIQAKNYIDSASKQIEEVISTYHASLHATREQLLNATQSESTLTKKHTEPDDENKEIKDILNDLVREGFITAVEATHIANEIATLRKLGYSQEDIVALWHGKAKYPWDDPFAKKLADLDKRYVQLAQAEKDIERWRKLNISDAEIAQKLSKKYPDLKINTAEDVAKFNPLPPGKKRIAEKIGRVLKEGEIEVEEKIVTLFKRAGLIGMTLGAGLDFNERLHKGDSITQASLATGASTVVGVYLGGVAGAEIGTMIPCPVVGTVVGALVGVAVGYLGGTAAGHIVEDICKERDIKGVQEGAVETIHDVENIGKSVVNGVTHAWHSLFH